MARVFTEQEQAYLKTLVRDTLLEMMRAPDEELVRALFEVLEDWALLQAIREGRQGDYVDEETIIGLLED